MVTVVVCGPTSAVAESIHRKTIRRRHKRSTEDTEKAEDTERAEDTEKGGD
jgi:hypothetical protein